MDAETQQQQHKKATTGFFDRIVGKQVIVYTTSGEVIKGVAIFGGTSVIGLATTARRQDGESPWRPENKIVYLPLGAVAEIEEQS